METTHERGEPDAGELAAVAEELYAAPPDGFIAARAAAVAQARARGHRDLARAIGGLRKPDHAAYAVNTVVRARPDLARRVADLGELLRDAQATLDGAALRDGARARRTLLEEIAAAVRELGAGPGRAASGAVLDKVAETIGAALADPGIAAMVLEGCLVRTPEPGGGFPEADVAAPVRSRAGVPPPQPDPPDSPRQPDPPRLPDQPDPTRQPDPPRPKRPAGAAARVAEAEQRLATADRELTAASLAEAAALEAAEHGRERYEDLARLLDDARRDAERARSAWEQATASRAAAAAAVDEAARALASAQRALE